MTKFQSSKSHWGCFNLALLYAEGPSSIGRWHRRPRNIRPRKTKPRKHDVLFVNTRLFFLSFCLFSRTKTPSNPTVSAAGPFHRFFFPNQQTKTPKLLLKPSSSSPPRRPSLLCSGSWPRGSLGAPGSASGSCGGRGVPGELAWGRWGAGGRSLWCFFLRWLLLGCFFF